ncbi:MAG: 1,4-alpha-glucan branching protein GlgB [Anaerolineae bacterium]|nr:1,4-alpha-glucan branching protein GlgB [Anaerolineae bacterium]
MTVDIHPDALNALVYGDHGAPFDILGLHPADDEHVTIRALRPTAKTLWVVNDSSGTSHEMTRVREEGFFEITLEGDPTTLTYHYEAQGFDGATETFYDPYIFPPLLTEYDIYLFNAGQHLDAYEKMGAHLREVNGVSGVNFAVWAPNARRISVVGDFNRWDERVHPMQMRGSSGIWELFIPGLGEGALYRYDVKSHVAAYQARKSDPFGFYCEKRPQNASIVANIDSYEWGDAAWMEARTKRNALNEPMTIYEMHLGSWKRKDDGTWYTYRELAPLIVDYLLRLNYTHVELLPVAEHPLDASWGYQTTGYFAPTSRYGTPTDFMYFVDYLHQHGLSVILDWVPTHFAKDGHALSYFDGTHLYSHADPRQGQHLEWGTYIFNYGRTEIRTFLLSNALFWLKKYHVDGFRVDAVSSVLYLNFGREEGQWIPNEHGGAENLEAISFLRELNEVVYREVPGVVTIAEESTSWPMVSRPTYLGGLGFTLKWNMGWMHDTLDYMKLDPVYRHYHHNQITFSMMYAFSENFVLSISHDEVVHLKGSLLNKMSGDWWQKFANVRLLFGYQYTHPGKKLNFMGAEIGQWSEWSEERSLDWSLLGWQNHEELQNWIRDLNALYKTQPALYEVDFDWKGFRWIEANDSQNSTAAYIRFAADQNNFIVAVLNFTPVVRYNHRIGVPQAGRYIELLNSDSAYYGGSNVGNGGGLGSEPVTSHGFEHSLTLTLPPLGIILLKLEHTEPNSK